jgi:hypothetical protein
MGFSIILRLYTDCDSASSYNTVLGGIWKHLPSHNIAEIHMGKSHLSFQHAVDREIRSPTTWLSKQLGGSQYLLSRLLNMSANRPGHFVLAGVSQSLVGMDSGTPASVFAGQGPAAVSGQEAEAQASIRVASRFTVLGLRGMLETEVTNHGGPRHERV